MTIAVYICEIYVYDKEYFKDFINFILSLIIIKKYITRVTMILLYNISTGRLIRG